jgi:hypothetical protein
MKIKMYEIIKNTHIKYKKALLVGLIFIIFSADNVCASQSPVGQNQGQRSNVDVRLIRENSENLPEISDIEDLENYERKLIKRLSGRNLLVYGGKRIDLTIEVAAGGGLGFAMSGKSSFIKKIIYFDFTLFFGINHSFLKNFRILINAGMISASFRYQSLKYYIGSDLIINYADDGKLKMFPVLFGLSYKLKIKKWIYLNFAFAGGISFNKQTLPNQPIVVDASTFIPNSVSRSSNDMALKGWFRAEFFITKGFSAALDVQIFMDRQPSYTDTDTLETKSGTIMMLMLGAQFGYRF